MRVKDNWEYVQDFCNDFGRLPKDVDELEYFLSYVDEKRQKAGCGITKMMETPVSDDLEEAAIRAAQSDMQDRQIMEASNDDRMRYSRTFRRGFKAGAKWGRRNLLQEIADGKTHPVDGITAAWLDNTEE